MRRKCGRTGVSGVGPQSGGVGLAGLQEGLPIGVGFQAGVLVVVESGTAQLPVIQRKTQGFYQMQCATGVGAQPNNVAGIGRDFWRNKDHLKHGGIVAVE